MEEPRLPSFYYVDESDPDIMVLCRKDGSFVAACSARGATREGITEAAIEDYRELIRAQADSRGRAPEERPGARPRNGTIQFDSRKCAPSSGSTAVPVVLAHQ